MKRVGLLGGLLVLAACRSHAEAVPSPGASAHPPSSASAAPPHKLAIDPGLLRTDRVRVEAAARRTLKGALVLPGEVKADEEGEGDATTLVSGRVASIAVTDGERVKKGDVLAWIDAPELGRVVADVLRARSRASQTERLLARQLELEGQEATSKNAVDEARAADRAAQADLLAARTLLRSFGASEPSAVGPGATAPIRSAVRAPIDGVVVSRATRLRSPVSPDRPLFHLVAPERVYVLAKKPETSRVPIDAKAVVTIRPREASTKDTATPCRARLVRSFDVVDEARNVPLRIAPESCPGLVVGRYVDVVLETDATLGEGIVVPKEAVVEVKGAQVAFVQQGDDGSFDARAVRLGPATANDVVLEEGVREGERVVVRGAVLLKGELLRAELASE